MRLHYLAGDRPGRDPPLPPPARSAGRGDGRAADGRDPTHVRRHRHRHSRLDGFDAEYAAPGAHPGCRRRLSGRRGQPQRARPRTRRTTGRSVSGVACGCDPHGRPSGDHPPPCLRRAICRPSRGSRYPARPAGHAQAGSGGGRTGHRQDPAGRGVHPLVRPARADGRRARAGASTALPTRYRGAAQPADAARVAGSLRRAASMPHSRLAGRGRPSAARIGGHTARSDRLSAGRRRVPAMGRGQSVLAVLANW